MAIGSVLVTGGAGFIGSALSRVLAPEAARWVAMDAMHPQIHPRPVRPDSLDPAAELVVADVTSPADWDRVLADLIPDTVIHLAAETGTAQSLDEASRHGRVNVVGTTEMIDALGRAGVTPDQVVLASSRAVYGEGVWRREDGTEFHPGQRSHDQLQSGLWDFEGAAALPSVAGRTTPSPTSVYGATKHVQEEILRAWGSARGVPISILRLQNVYGPGQSLTNPYTGIVSLFSRLAREGVSIPLYEDGQIVRDFVYIDDVAAALAAVVRAGEDRHRPVLDIGSGVATTIEGLASSIARFHGAPDPHITGLFRDGDVRFAATEVGDALVTLGWSPSWELDRGIGELQTWIAAELDSPDAVHGVRN